MSVKKRKSPRHPFRFKVQVSPRRWEMLTGMAKVKKARQKVTLVLTADDVRESILRKGVGNTHDCSMAICAKRLEDRFPHPVDGGYIDWTYRMCYVVTKLDKETRLPAECVAYEHQDSVAHLNDSLDGQRKLLEILEEDGDRTIILHPPVHRPREAGKSKGRNTGERARVKTFHGAKQRFTSAKLGGAFES